jgi:hypothetical protein
MKLSENAARLLVLIGDYTERDDSQRLTRYWVPADRRQWCGTLDGYVIVGGGGDAASLGMLERRGLIERTSKEHRYYFAITESGRVAVERMRESDTFPKPNGDY